MKKQNNLKKVIAKICEKKNEGKKPREKKYWPKYEMQKIAETLGVSWGTVYTWYHNQAQPKGENEFKILKMYKMAWSRFYFY